MTKHACVLLLLLLTVTGCAIQSSPGYASFREEVNSWGYMDYFGMTLKDLLVDFVDIFSTEFSLGPGVILDVQMTKLTEHGFGFANIERFGHRGRAAGFYAETRKEGGVSGLYYRSLDFDPQVGNASLFQRPRSIRDFTLRHNDDRNWADCGFTFHIVYVGFSFYISPMNAVDFMVDIVTLPYNIVARPSIAKAGFDPPELDLGNDDTMAATRKKYNVDVVRPLEGFPPAEWISDVFNVGY